MNDYLLLAIEHHRAGQFQLADAFYAQALDQNPDNSDALHGRGLLAHQLGRHDTAVSLVEKALRLQPWNAHYNNNLGLFYQHLGRIDEAIVTFRRALSYEPGNAALHSNLSNTLNIKGDFADGERHGREAVQINPRFASAFLNLGNALVGLGRYLEAVSCFRHVIELEPRSAPGFRNLGHALFEMGRFDDARQAYEAALRIDPSDTHSLYSLSRLRSFQSADDPEIERLKARLAAGNLPDGQRAELHFSLGKALDDCGAYDEAFAHFEQGNRLKRMKFDRFTHLYAVHALKEAFQPTAIRQVPAAGSDSQTPVFIVGMFRSGTSLVEQILASHPEVYGCGELPDIEQFATRLRAQYAAAQLWPQCLLSLEPRQLTALAEEYLQNRREAAPEARRVIDKMPTNFFQLGLIWRLFPNARIIHCRRDPLDTCLSCYFVDFSASHPFAYDLEDLGVFYRSYEAIMKHWKAVLPVSILDVQYEELVAHPEREARRMLDFCGLSWNERCLKFYETRRPVRTASNWQVRQPIYDRSVGRARNYARHLTPLIASLGTPLDHPLEMPSD